MMIALFDVTWMVDSEKEDSSVEVSRPSLLQIFFFITA